MEETQEKKFKHVFDFYSFIIGLKIQIFNISEYNGTISIKYKIIDQNR